MEPLVLMGTSKSPETRPTRSVYQKSWIPMIPPFLGITLISFISIIVWGIWLGHYLPPAAFVQLVEDHRTTVQVFVQLLSITFGALWTWAFCGTLLHVTRHQLAMRPVSLNELKLWNALATGPRLDWSLKLWPLLLIAVCLGITQIPSVLWTGALTPILTNRHYHHQIPVPPLGYCSYCFMNGSDDSSVQSNELIRPNGTYSRSPLVFASDLLSGASDAVTADGSVRNHTKLDNTNYHFVGRSYGIGSSVGLVDAAWAQGNNIRDYIYQEVGFHAEVRCIYNNSAAWVIWPTPIFVGPEVAIGVPNIYKANGSLPDGVYTWSAQPAWQNAGNVVAMSTSAKEPFNSTELGMEYTIGIAAGSRWQPLDKIQCTAKFQPRNFQVRVSSQKSQIHVIPHDQLSKTQARPDPFLAYQAMYNLGRLSQTQTTLYISSLGNAFMQNVAKAQTFKQEKLTPDLDEITNNQTTLWAVAQSLTSIIDDMISLQGMFALSVGHINETSVSGEAVAIAIGSGGYINSILAANLILWIAVVTVLMQSTWHKRIPLFDYTDLSCMVVGAALGAKYQQISSGATGDPPRTGKPEESEKLIGASVVSVSGAPDSIHNNQLLEPELLQYTGDPSDVNAGALKVCLRVTNHEQESIGLQLI